MEVKLIITYIPELEMNLYKRYPLSKPVSLKNLVPDLCRTGRAAGSIKKHAI